MLITRQRSLRETMIAEVTQAAGRPAKERSAAIAAILADAAMEPALLAEIDCPERPDCYCRHLLHADPAGRFALVALVWRPGQMSPVHAHRTWCALAVHRGTLTESFYRRPAAEAELEAVATVLRRPGDSSHGAADPELVHRIANLGCRTAVSIHVYGARYDRFGEEVNLVYAA